MARGGKRDGAGRPTGAIKKRTGEAVGRALPTSKQDDPSPTWGNMSR